MAAAAALFGSVMVDAFHQAVAVPSLPAGVFQQATYVEFREVPPPEETPPEQPEAQAPLPPEEVLEEHTVDESDYEIDAKPAPPPPPPEPVPEPEPEPEAEPVVLPPQPEPEPEPVPAPPPEPPKPPEPKPEPKREPKPEPKPQPKPAPAPKKVVEKSVQKKAPPAQKKAPALPADEVGAPVPPSADAVPGDANRAGSPGLLDGEKPGGVGAGLAGTSRASSDGKDRNEAIAQIIAIIEANKSYPRRARQTGQEGVVLLAVHVNAAGVVESVEVLQKHPSVLLNRAAKNAAEPLIGVKTPLKAALTLEVPVKFDLKR